MEAHLIAILRQIIMGSLIITIILCIFKTNPKVDSLRREHLGWFIIL